MSYVANRTTRQLPGIAEDFVSEPLLLTHRRSLFDWITVVSNPGVPAVFSRVNAPDGFGEEAWLPAVPDSLFAVRLQGALVKKVTGSRARVRRSPFSNWAFQPKGTTNSFLAGGNIAFAQLFLSDEFLDRVSERLDQPAIRQRLRDDLVFAADRPMEDQLSSCLRRCFDVTNPPLTIEMKGRVLLIVDRLHFLHAGASQRARYTAGLSPKRLRVVQQFLIEHLDEDVRLADLAQHAKHSVKHFARAFRQSTGMPPHRYLVHLRIERAKELLARNKGPLSDVSAACGFADQSHFTATFRKIVGVTPGEYRTELQR